MPHFSTSAPMRASERSLSASAGVPPLPASTAFTPPSALKTAVTLSKPQFFKISALSVTHTLKSSAASTSLSAIEQSAPATNLKAV